MNNASKGIIPWNRKVYKEFHRDICEAAQSAYIDPMLLAVTIQHEGSGRAVLSRLPGSVGKGIELEAGRILRWAGIDKGASVGYGQMRYDTAIDLLNSRFGMALEKDVNGDIDTVAKTLIEDSRGAIFLSAYYLFQLQATYHLNSKEAFIAYALDDKGIRSAFENSFSGEV